MIYELEERIKRLEDLMRDSEYDTRHAVKSELYQHQRMDIQKSGCPHLFSALCVNTIDPMAEGQVQFYTPYMTLPGTPVSALPWAYPISPFGGFDDCGVTWVPPAGSKLALFCENGDLNQAYYVGTFWTSTRGLPIENSIKLPAPDDSRVDLWGYSIPEYNCIWEGTRNGYLVGSNEGDQVKMPWNTDNYQIKDWDTQTGFSTDPTFNQYITYPHQYGFKTPEKHYLKMVDGDHKCNHRFRRLELATGRSNMFMMKDDHLHPAAQWAYGSTGSNCHTPIQDYTDCTTATEGTNCQSSFNEDTFANPFFKRQEEMRFYQPPSSLARYQNPKCELPQSGIQLQSISGMQFVMDDSVEQPQGDPRWNLDFDWGCTDVFKGKMFMRSTTGHMIEINDEEDDTLIRSKNNGIKLITASGNKVVLNDHTLGFKSNPDEAGDSRGVLIQSTAKHILEFHDEGNKQFSEERRQASLDSDGQPIDITESKADKAYVLLRSGYGLQIRMQDAYDQVHTEQQYLQIVAPQWDNAERGSHQIILQEQADGPGLVLLRAGGIYYRSSYDDAIEVVGDEGSGNTANKFVQVTGNYIVDTTQYYFNKSDITIFQAEKYICLYAGRDCPPEPTSEMTPEEVLQNALAGNPLQKNPCAYPLILGKNGFFVNTANGNLALCFGIEFMTNPDDNTKTIILNNSMSDRVFASSSPAGTESEE